MQWKTGMLQHGETALPYGIHCSIFLEVKITTRQYIFEIVLEKKKLKIIQFL
jgi:hypothetical protein